MGKYILQLKHYIFLIIDCLCINPYDLIPEIVNEEELLEERVDVASRS